MDPIEAISSIQLVGGLDCSIYCYKLVTNNGPVPMISFVTSGFAEKNHPELAVHIKIQDEDGFEEYPPQSLDSHEDFLESLSVYKLFTLLFKICDNAPLTQRKTTKFSKGFLGLSDIKGVIYTVVNNFRYPDGILKENVLYFTVIALTQKELEIAELCPQRCLIKIGQAMDEFPFPIYCDRERNCSINPELDLSESIFNKSSAYNFPDCRVAYEHTDEKIKITIPKFELPRIKKILNGTELDSIVIFNSGNSPEIDSYINWNPEDTGELDLLNVNILSDPFRDRKITSGSFFGFVPSQEQDEAIFYEDGTNVNSLSNI
eukprot:TRINITY_DN7647_c0_g1_i2.p1 TRINITY_DN7647_c0_g1~~TRINITY_DN7647_c0_g1_i2.p1  ORF type:complete len:331 (-),score=70.12 TRINITY_DN7647_c0_g1_i2:533-1486(-)